MTDALKASRSTGPGHQGAATRNLLVIAEVALSVVLLVSAGLTLRTFMVLQNTDTGMQTDQVLFVGVPLPPAKYGPWRRGTSSRMELLDRVSRLPGVQAATFGVPLGGARTTYVIPGVKPDDQRRMGIFIGGVDYLRTFGVALHRRPHVRCGGGDARRSGRTRQRVGRPAVAGRREPDRHARAPGGPRAPPGAAGRTRRWSRR